MYYRGAARAILVYDMTKKSSFEKLQKWVDELKERGPDGIVLCVAANKCDLEEGREVGGRGRGVRPKEWSGLLRDVGEERRETWPHLPWSRTSSARARRRGPRASQAGRGASQRTSCCG